MITKSPSLRDQKAEAEHIKAQLKLRWNTEHGCYEVYTTIHGTGVFRWYKISEETARWYSGKFNIHPMPVPYVVDGETGVLKVYAESFGNKIGD